MMIKNDKELIAGIEIGTTKIVVLIGEILINKKIKILGMGQCPSRGIDKGNINNLQAVTHCIKKAIYDAESTSKIKISKIYLAFSNQSIRCQNEIGIVPIYKNEVKKNDLEYAIYTAQAIKLHRDYSILHVIPQEYSIDRNKGIKNPIGLSGFRMEAKVHLITHQNQFKKNIIKALNQCNIKINKTVFSGLAASTEILTTEEKKSGVCMIDIGGDNMNIIIYTNGSIQHSQVIPYAGNTITNDIAYAFNTSFKNAEKIKIKYGSTISASLSTSELIKISNISGVSTKHIQQNMLIEVIESRYLELFNITNNIILNIQKKLYQKNKPNVLGSGIVLTGGSVKIKTIKNFAKKVFNMPIRIGIPRNIKTYNDEIMQPEYSTIIGLLQYGFKIKNYKNDQMKINKNNTTWFDNFKNWFKKILKI